MAFTPNGCISPLPPLRVSYFQRVRNIGDAVNPYLLESVAGRQVVSARSTELSYLLAVGSLLQNSTRQSFIWGTGLIQAGVGIGDPDPKRVLAIRGKLTYAELVRHGVAVGDVPLGDPGVLVPRLLFRSISVQPRFELGLVPYVFDRDHPFFAAAAEDPGVKVLDVCGPVEVFFAELASCRAIASSSLHGLVFGEALGLPTAWLKVSDRVVGGEFKFADWFSLARNPQDKPLRPRDFICREIVRACEPRQVEIDTQALLQTITPEIIDECSRTTGPARSMLSVPVCRSRPLPVFVLSHNNTAGLLRTVSWCRGQHKPVEIAIYDDGSDEPETVAALSRLEGGGFHVYRRNRDDAPELLARFNNAIRNFFQSWAEPSRYAVTSCEADSLPAEPGALDLYDKLLDCFPRADSAGPVMEAGSGSETIVNTAGAPPGLDRGPVAIVPHRCIVVEGGFEAGLAVYRAGRPLLAVMKCLRVCGPQGRT